MTLNAHSNTPNLAPLTTPTRPGDPMQTTFATSQPAAIDMERNHGITTALALIVAGRPGRAQYELVRSVQRQVRIAGLGDWPIAPTCSCGGRCSS